MKVNLVNMFKLTFMVIWIVYPDTIAGTEVPPLPSPSPSPQSLPQPPPPSSPFTPPLSSRNTISTSLFSSTDATTSSTGPVGKTKSNEREESNEIVDFDGQENLHSPKFNQTEYITAILESTKPGSPVIRVSASDADKPGSKAATVQYLLLTSGSPFTISPETGMIYLKEPLDYERSAKHHLIVAASDQGSPLHTSTCQVWINVTDVNDNVPKFSQASYTAVISEKSPENMFVTKVTAYDMDYSDNHENRLKYAIVSGNEDSVFSLNPNNGILTRTAQKFVFLDFNLNISVTDGRHYDYTSVHIKILLDNKYSPRFKHPSYSVVINESVPIGTKILNVKAYDNDDELYGEVTHSILSSYLLKWFKIDPKTGDITTVGKIDREQHKVFSLTVLAKDGGNRIGVTMVNITVVNVNDNAPEFLVDKYEAAVCSNISPKSNIIPVYAYDKDFTRNNKNIVHYSLHHIGLPETTSRSPQTSSSIFGIRKKTGYIYVTGNLSHHIGSVYAFQVKARDTGGLEAVVPVTIKINGPCKMEDDLVAHFEASVSEMTKPDTVVTTVNATDLENFELSLVGSKPESGKFKLGDQGRIYLTEPLDREKASRHILVLRMFDKKTFSIRYLNFFIDVIDSNDNGPQFDAEAYWIEVSEDQEVGSAIMRVHANDFDSEESQIPIHYRMKKGKRKSGQHGGDYFDLDPDTGLLRLRRPLDRETDEWHNLTMIATDGKFNSKASLYIRVMDTNDNPPKFEHSAYTAAIVEDAPIGLDIITLEASDADLAGKNSLRYFITQGDPYNQFRINDSGKLLVNKNPDRKKMDKYELEILASDSKFSATTKLFIDVLEAKPGRPICGRDGVDKYLEIVSEDVEIGSKVLTVEAQTKDDGLSNSVQLYYLLFFDEKDPDAENVELPFALDSKTGVLTTIAPLDREKKSTYLLLAKVHDDKERSKVCTSPIEIIISDKNDNPPKFTSREYHVSVPEDAKIGLIIGKIHAEDPDLGSNGQVRYSLVHSGDGTFTIDEKEGLIELNKPLDREEVEIYNLTVKASDLGDPPLSSLVKFTVEIQDVNDNAPEFTKNLYTVSVYENVTVGAELTQVAATSRDIGINADITYTIIDGNEDNCFTINPKSGIISLTKTLDRETVEDYFLTVKAEDGGIPPLSSETKVAIKVLDVDDNGPVCEMPEYTEMVPEDIEIGSYILTVKASDADEGDNGRLFYNLSFDQKDPDAGKGYLPPFTIDPRDGFLTTRGPLDREEKSKYLLLATVHDDKERSRVCSSTVEILVSDVNDNPPFFTGNDHFFYVPEDSKVETVIGKIQAFDRDTGENSLINYYLVDSGDEHFTIEKKTGILRLAKPLDREEKEIFNITVKVVDLGNPPLSSSQVFVINVQDVNDNAPEFQQKSYAAEVYENATIGKELVQVLATSKDTGANAEITYTIIAGNQDNSFMVHPESGIISVAKPLDREHVDEYILIVQAEDGGIPPLSSETKVNITILDINDNAPQFGQKTYTAIIREDTLVGEKILQKVATDADIGKNGQVNYFFTGGSTNGEIIHQLRFKEFEIESKTGIITVAKPLDRKMISSYLMEIVAVDEGQPPLFSSILITIEISNVNRCVCPLDGSSSSVCVNFNNPISSTSDRAFIWDDLILPGIFIIILLFTFCVIITCCCFNRRQPNKTRHNRAPTNVYLAGLDSNEFLLKNCNAFPDNSVNIRRFSKLSGVESSALLGHGPFSTEPLPNHHFHQALQQATTVTNRPNSFSETLNNFDDVKSFTVNPVNEIVGAKVNKRPNSFSETLNNFDDVTNLTVNPVSETNLTVNPASETGNDVQDVVSSRSNIPKISPPIVSSPSNERSRLTWSI